MTVGERLEAAALRLAAAGVESARHDAEELLAHVASTPRSRLQSLSDLDPETVRRFDEAVLRRARREPLQHITGVAGFRYLELRVGPGVFVPRPETEVMTGVAIDEAGRLTATGVERPVVVDLCTGSGAIALAIATEAAATRVVGAEISPAAHAYAVANARAVGAGVDFRLGDIATMLGDLRGQAHIVTANPPYIPLEAWESVAAEARDFDPPEALWSGDDGLDLTRVVARVAAGLLVDGGLLLCEHADAQGIAGPAVFAGTGEWSDVRDNADLAGRPRFVTARRVPRPVGPPGTMSG